MTDARIWVRLTKNRALLLVPLLATICFWPFLDSGAHSGIDGSWQLALHETVSRGLHWGPDVAFTYGPLGFLSVPTPYLGWTSTLALAFGAVVYVALATFVFVSGRRTAPGWVAILATIGAARTFPALPTFEALQALSFLFAIQLVVSDRPARWRLVVTGTGTLVALCLLGKFNVGLIVGALMGVTAVRIGRPWWAGLLLVAGSAAASTTALWLLAGQAIGDLPKFIATSLDISRGYSDAMARDLFATPSLLYVLFLICLGLVGLGALDAWRTLKATQIAAIVAVTLILSFALWKAAFTRLDTHVALAFATINVVAFTLMAPARRLHLSIPIGAVTLLVCLALSGTTATTFTYIPDALAAAGSQFANAIVPGRQDVAASAARASLRDQYGLDADILAALAGGTVHIDPWEAGIATAYPELQWSPLPVFQSYIAYTSDLDRTNAARLSSPAAPSRILRAPFVIDGIVQAVDGRNPWFEAPSAMLQMLCRYEPVAMSDQWEVLARTHRTCGAPEILDSRTARAGEVVAVPSETRPDRFVIVQVTGLAPSLLESLKSTLWKGTKWYATLDGHLDFRLIAATAADGLILATPSQLIGGPRFSSGPPTRTISVFAGDDGRASSATLTFEFLSVPWLQ